MVNKLPGALLMVSVAAASCWDGSLDPVLGSGDSDADSDSDGDTETDSATVVDTEMVSCSVSVVIEVWVEEGDYYTPYCEFMVEGACRSDSSECVGCAWQDAENGLCDGSGACCVPETSFPTCEPYVSWCPSLLCGYFEDACPDYTEAVSAEEQLECQGGEFCCYVPD